MAQKSPIWWCSGDICRCKRKVTPRKRKKVDKGTHRDKFVHCSLLSDNSENKVARKLGKNLCPSGGLTQACTGTGYKIIYKRSPSQVESLQYNNRLHMTVCFINFIICGTAADTDHAILTISQ